MEWIKSVAILGLPMALAFVIAPAAELAENKGTRLGTIADLSSSNRRVNN